MRFTLTECTDRQTSEVVLQKISRNMQPQNVQDRRTAPPAEFVADLRTYVRTYLSTYARSVHTQSIQPRAQDCLRDRPRAQSGFSSSRVSKNGWVSSPPVCASKSAATCLACS